MSKKRKKNTKIKKRKISNTNKTKNSIDKNAKTEKSIVKKGVYKVLNNFKIDIMSKWLDYTDTRYVNLELKTKDYFDDTFDVYIKSLKELMYKSNITTTEKFDAILRGYIEKWIKELTKFSEGFSIETNGYFQMLLDEIDTQDVFNNLCYEYNDELTIKQLIKEFIEKNAMCLVDYNEIYEEEYTSYSKQLLLSKGHIIDKTIHEFLEHKNSEYQYKDNKFIEESTHKLIYIDKYQELNKIAEKHGYFHDRSNGGHGIFINNDKAKKSIVIPQGRKIGRGLSILIQKQILGKANPIIGVEERNINQSKKMKN